MKAYILRINFKEGDKLYSVLDVDLRTKTLMVRNFTDNNMLRAFGVNEHPTWEDFEAFLLDRVMPPTRHNVREVLDELGLDHYDPLEVALKTEGRSADDPMHMEFEWREVDADA